MKSSNGFTAEYVIARLYPGVFSVAKFEGGEQPTSVYKVDLNLPAGRQCQCWPQHNTKTCKHVKMVRERAKHLLTEGVP